MNSIKRMVRHLIFIGVLAFTCSACCMTARVEGTVYEKSSPFHEFKEMAANCSALQINSGSYIGETELNWTAYHTYQFNGLLKGFDIRILEILVPIDNEDGKKLAILRESDQKQKKILPAYLLVKYRNADTYCDELEPIEAEFRQQYSSHAIILNDDTFRRMIYADPKNESNGGNEWLSINMEPELQWLYRDSESVRLHKLRYFYSVPLDVVLFPICLLGLIPPG